MTALQVTEESLRFLMFGNFTDAGAENGNKRYEEIPSIAAFVSVAEAAMGEYNATHRTKMDFVLFRYWSKFVLILLCFPLAVLCLAMKHWKKCSGILHHVN
jgi:hypothetical protein